MKHTADHHQDKELSAQRRLAEAIRAACLQAALDGYEDARMDGLCHEGAWENAIEAIRGLDIEAVLKQNE
jgi:hypothetical protein